MPKPKYLELDPDKKQKPHSSIRPVMAKPKNPAPKLYKMEAPSGRIFWETRESRDILVRTFGWIKL